MRAAILFVPLLSGFGEGCLSGGDDFTGSHDSGPPPFDCSQIPHPPFEVTRIAQARIHEDLAFDAEGNVVGWGDNSLFRTPYSGDPRPFAPGTPTVYGMRFLPNGDLVAADGVTGSLLRIEPDGTIHTVLSGLSFPNGVTVDMQGQVYLGEFGGNRVSRVDPMTGDVTTLLDGTVPSPNGISFDPTYRRLYIGGWAEYILYALEIGEDGTPGDLTHFAEQPITMGGLLHGLATDVCGNVYSSEIFGGYATGGYGPGSIVYRIPPGGGEREILFDTSDIGETDALISNIEWGSGIGGWGADNLYLTHDYTGGVYELRIGVPSKPRPYPPAGGAEEE